MSKLRIICPITPLLNPLSDSLSPLFRSYLQRHYSAVCANTRDHLHQLRPLSPLSYGHHQLFHHGTTTRDITLALPYHYHQRRHLAFPSARYYHSTGSMDRPQMTAKAVAPNDDGDWKNRPPYRTTDTNAQFDKKFTAHCHCGRVKYWLSRDRPLAAKFCHCADCQALHGAPFQWAAIFEKQDLHFENGAEGLAFYHSGTRETRYELPVKVSCAFCHAPIMDEGRRMVLMFPAIIDFRDAEHKKLFDPQCHIFYSQRVVDLPDGKPKWTGLDGASELMKDVDTHQMESVVGKREVETIDE